MRRALAAWRALAGLGLAGAAAAGAEPTVIQLSWDGVRHDYPQRVGARAPALARLAAEGARAERLLPVFPSSTFPGHVSLATGTFPDRHGIVDNRFFDRERGVFRMANDASWIEAEPLWAAAERQGVPAAVFFWVGSETDWRGVGARHRKAPFDSGIGEAEKVRQILAWLDLPGPDRPRLVMAWWHGADRAGHRAGPDDESVDAALAEQDAHLADLLAGLDARGLWDETTLLLVSDHGMTRVRGEVPVRDHLAASGLPATVHSGAAVAHVFLDDPARADAVRRSLSSLRHVRVFAGAELPAALRLRHPTRTGDFVVLAEPGWVFRGTSLRHRAWRWLAGWFGSDTGMHGYAPDHPDMGGVLLARGRGVSAGTRLGAVRMVDVAPTVAALLGIDPPRHAEGEPIQDLLPRSADGRGP
ncbi:MAG: alkaline phosphatase family protein [Myxococcota bacterium]